MPLSNAKCRCFFSISAGVILLFTSISAKANICDLFLSSHHEKTQREDSSLGTMIYRNYWYSNLHSTDHNIQSVLNETSFDTNQYIQNDQRLSSHLSSYAWNVRAHVSLKIAKERKYIGSSIGETIMGAETISFNLEGISPDTIYDIQLSHQGTYFAVTRDNIIHVWQTDDVKGKDSVTLTSAIASYYPFSASSKIIRTEFLDDDRLMEVTEDGKVAIMNVKTNSPALYFAFGEELVLNEFSSFNQNLAVVTKSNKVKYLSVKLGTEGIKN